MSATTQQVAEAIVTDVLSAIDGLNAYATPEELPRAPGNGGAACELIVADTMFALPDCEGYRVMFDAEVSVPTEGKGWGRAFAIVRDYCSPAGSNSIRAAVLAAGYVTAGTSNVLIRCNAIRGERRIEYGDSWRAVGAVIIEAVWS